MLREAAFHDLEPVRGVIEQRVVTCGELLDVLPQRDQLRLSILRLGRHLRDARALLGR